MPKINSEAYMTDRYAIAELKARSFNSHRFSPEDEPEGRKHPRGTDSGDSAPKPGRLPHTYHNLDLLRAGFRPEGRDLLERFVLHRGPYAVWNAARREERKKSGDSNLVDPKMAVAVGVTFERLTYLWATDSALPGDDFYLDPGSCGRIFQAIRASFAPDGAIIHSGKSTEIKHVFDCKTNLSANPEKTSGQLEAMRDFMDKNRGETHHLNYDVVVERGRGIKSKSIRISPNATLTLVVPMGMRPSHEIPGFHVLETPFSASFVKAIARASLEDASQEYDPNPHR